MTSVGGEKSKLSESVTRFRPNSRTCEFCHSILDKHFYRTYCAAKGEGTQFDGLLLLWNNEGKSCVM